MNRLKVKSLRIKKKPEPIVEQVRSCIQVYIFSLAHSKTFIMTDPPCFCKDVKAHRIKQAIL